MIEKKEGESNMSFMQRMLKPAADDNGHPITQPRYDELTAELKRIGWKDTGDGQHENIKEFIDHLIVESYKAGFDAAVDILQQRGDSCNCVDALRKAK